MNSSHLTSSDLASHKFKLDTIIYFFFLFFKTKFRLLGTNLNNLFIH